MRKTDVINLVYFSLLTIAALFWVLPPRSRVQAIVMGVLGLVVTGTSVYAGEIVRDWLPVPLMALAYWQSGSFFQRPNPPLQARFDRWDRKLLGVVPRGLALSSRRWIADSLELAYVFCYPVVPLGLAAIYLAGLRHYADHYWVVVLMSAYPCYALLPFVQLLPPRSLKGSEEVEGSSPFRRFNLWIVGRVTHRANTFPSGHVAASAAIALVLLRLRWEIGLIFLFIAAGIALGCVVGRYHYAVDVVVAIALALTVFVLTGIS